MQAVEKAGIGAFGSFDSFGLRAAAARFVLPMPRKFYQNFHWRPKLLRREPQILLLFPLSFIFM